MTIKTGPTIGTTATTAATTPPPSPAHTAMLSGAITAAFLAITIIITMALAPPAKAMDQHESFIYSGGCFWCTEADSEKLDGVIDTISGFTGGTTENPRYYSGKWGDHREAAKVIYDPEVIRFEDLVKHVFKTVDYEDDGGQFCDRGHSYSPAIYVKTDEQAAIAKALAPATSVVPIERESTFYPVREEHQDFYKKRSVKYKFYRFNCGRDRRIERLNKKG